MKTGDFSTLLSQALPKVERWRLPSSQEQATRWLKQSYKHIVAHFTDSDQETKLSHELETNLTEVAKWLTDDTAGRWLLLRGKLGNGKTTTLRAIKLMLDVLYRNETQRPEKLAIHTAVDITEMIRRDLIDDFDVVKRERFLAIDDLGSEPTITNYYGNYSSPVLDLLYSRYEKRRLTILSTNLSNRELLEKYGARFYDRLRQMAMIVTFSGESFRGGENAQKHI